MSDTVTPMMAQYHALKAQAPDCLLFYRMGDFFELFFEDAKVAAACLDIALTARGSDRGEPVPMCGVPCHSAESYLARLIRGGHRVAVAEQVESPAEARKRGGSKALVERAIVRIVTAGTLIEEALLEARTANWLVAVAEVGGTLGLAAADISTGRFEVQPMEQAELPAELARLDAAEVIVAEGSELVPGATVTGRFDSAEAERRLKARFGVATLDGYGSFSRAELAAAGGLLAYLDRAGAGSPLFLQPPRRRVSADHMMIDAATRESLEIMRAAGGGRRGSLLDAIDRTVTGAGARLLAVDLGAPLVEQKAIEARLGLVQWLVEDGAEREVLRTELRTIPDLGRALGRLVARRGSPRDLAQVRDGLAGAQLMHDRLSKLVGPPLLLAGLLVPLCGHGGLVDELTRALVATPPMEASQGSYIAEGYDAALDELRAASGAGQRAIAALEARYREQTGVAQLRIRHNNVLGYHIEVPARLADRLLEADSGFTHRQTMAGAVRFNAADLHEQASRVAQAGAHALTAEAAHLESLIDLALLNTTAIADCADALARLDVAAGLAERASEDGWCRPTFAEEPSFAVEGGRHPVVERAVAKAGGRFVANDCRLSTDRRLWLVTGPNMGGKSTFLRQNAIIAVLAQSGSFVPATSCRMGLVDRLFSRVGAADNLARGRSTFMVEMVETASILAQATERSIVILDEVGRGTSTYDGLAIAWAVVEAVHDTNRCRCLFATHYHELTRLAERLDGIALHHVRAREWKGDLVLLHELAPGPADRSYGIAVARLAGLPPSVLKRAKSVLAKLEEGRAKTGGIAAGLDELPLFAAIAREDDATPEPLREAVAALDVDALSPRDALEALYRLKRIVEE